MPKSSITAIYPFKIGVFHSTHTFSNKHLISSMMIIKPHLPNGSFRSYQLDESNANF